MLLERLGIAVHRFPNYRKGDLTASMMTHEAELRELWAKGYGDAKIGRQFGVSQWIIRGVRRKLGVGPQPTHEKWKQRKDELLAMLRKGMKRSEIAREFGVTRNAIVGACHRLNLGEDEIVKTKTRELIRDQMRALSLRGVAKRKANGNKNIKKKTTTAATMINREVWRFNMRAKAPPPDSVTRCTILELKRCNCRYPIDGVDAPPGGFYCGATTETENSSWCAYHAKFVIRGLSGDVGGSLQRHPGQGVETVHNGPPAQVTARPHSAIRRNSGYWNPISQEVV